jgi:hypothetical protein
MGGLFLKFDFAGLALAEGLEERGDLALKMGRGLHDEFAGLDDHGAGGDGARAGPGGAADGLPGFGVDAFADADHELEGRMDQGGDLAGADGDDFGDGEQVDDVEDLGGLVRVRGVFLDGFCE